jgi:predicted CXXCH cytochrome family protein
MKYIAGVAAVTTLIGLVLMAQGGVAGSAHDLSSQGWAQGEICILCHTPHNAPTPQLVPLWNHQTTAATFTLYGSASLHNLPGQPGPQSKSCLSCHDGTVAVDSFGGATGSRYISGPALIGTDLSDDHPVGMTFHHENGLNCQNCHQIHPWGFGSVLPFYDGRVECATCHDVHNNHVAGPHLVRKTLTQSALCLHCHAK